MPKTAFKPNENIINETISKENKIILNTSKKELNDEWKIEIPKINLIAKIKEGTDEKTLNEYVGHFEETNKINGNIGLAAHNRGYKVNYFNRLKELEKGDLIYYKYKDIELIFEVHEERIIKDTDWSVLEKTKENYLTLITCLENVPEKRRCIIAKEKI